MLTVCRRPKGGGGPAHVDARGQGRGLKNVIFCGCHKWMAPIQNRKLNSNSLLLYVTPLANTEQTVKFSKPALNVQRPLAPIQALCWSYITASNLHSIFAVLFAYGHNLKPLLRLCVLACETSLKFRNFTVRYP